MRKRAALVAIAVDYTGLARRSRSVLIVRGEPPLDAVRRFLARNPGFMGSAPALRYLLKWRTAGRYRKWRRGKRIAGWLGPVTIGTMETR
jgi:hypothetical protein